MNNNSRILQTGKNQITQKFGGSHGGIDIVKEHNQLDGIIAHSSGTVTFCQKGHTNHKGASGNASYGNCVKIKHDNGYSTLYAHLGTVSVDLGQTVQKGEKIGYMGNTGNSYGAHLHFEIRNKSNVRIDPQPYLNHDLPGETIKLEIDGRWGMETTKALQRKLGTEADGVISNQSIISIALHKECSASSWRWNENAKGSNCIKALQKFLGGLTVDGKCGRLTIKALQKYLNISQTGFLNTETVKALQNFINE